MRHVVQLAQFLTPDLLSDADSFDCYEGGRLSSPPATCHSVNNHMLHENSEQCLRLVWPHVTA